MMYEGLLKEKYQKNLFILALIITPSLFLTVLPDPFEFLKTYFLILLFNVSSLLSIKTKKFKKTHGYKIYAVELFLIFFILLNLISTLFATNLYTSLFGYFDRFAGSLIFFLSLILTLITNRRIIYDLKIEKIVRYILCGSIVPVFYGYVQVLGLDFIEWENSGNRVFSTFGQPNWFASYLVVILVLLWVEFLENR